MLVSFYIAAAVATAATIMVITRRNAVHALLYLVVSLLAVAVVFYTLGAPFAAALEVIVYAGAIMVLFVFVVMMLRVGDEQADERDVDEENGTGPPTDFMSWAGPGALAGILLGQLGYLLMTVDPAGLAGEVMVEAKTIGIALYGPYLVGVELVSFLLLTGLVGAYHIGRRRTS